MFLSPEELFLFIRYKSNAVFFHLLPFMQEMILFFTKILLISIKSLFLKYLLLRYNKGIKIMILFLKLVIEE